MDICSVTNCNEKHYGKGYCKKHYNQYRYHGKILERNKHDRNEINIIDDVCYMNLYNRKNMIVATTIFNTTHKETIQKIKWCLDRNGRVISFLSDLDGRYYISLHSKIIELTGQIISNGYEIDHIDRNPLNNLDNNLRICTHSQNSHNIKLRKNNTSGQIGVSWHKQCKKWQVKITINLKEIPLGLFDDLYDAARAYNAAAIKYHGEFAVLNIIPSLPFIGGV